MAAQSQQLGRAASCNVTWLSSSVSGFVAVFVFVVVVVVFVAALVAVVVVDVVVCLMLLVLDGGHFVCTCDVCSPSAGVASRAKCCHSASEIGERQRIDKTLA